jgi:periplasmic mercuric ion binding protein
MKFIKLLAVFVSAVFATAAYANPSTIRAEVNGMVCAFCAQGIDARLRKNAATKDVFVNLKNRIVAVEIKQGTTFSLENFKADILESGYSVTKVEYVVQPLSEIRASYKK